MFVDFSGSMNSNMEGTIEQLINLVLFCKKVSIPFEVYGFGNSGVDYGDNNKEGIGLKDGDLVCASFVLRKFVSNKLSSREYSRALDYLFFLKTRYSNGSGYSYYNESMLNETRYQVTCPSHDQLGSTPLDDAIVAAAGIVKDFRDSNSVQICNVVFLTDGESNPISQYWSSADGDARSLRGYSGGNFVLRDEKTKKSFVLGSGSGSRYYWMTGFLLSSLAERCNVKIAGFRILPGNTRKAKEELRQFITGQGSINDRNDDYVYVQDYVESLFEILKKDGSASVNISGYNELFVVRGDSNLKTSEDGVLDDVADDAKVADIRKAFKKNSKGKLKTRVMLTKFIDMIA
jgi:hypothetical protein